jgi:hypothetical protein
MKTKNIISILVMTALLTLTAVAVVYGLTGYLPR